MQGTSTVATKTAEAPPQQGACRNCGALLTGPYCAHCGQTAETRLPTFREMTRDFFDALFGLDSRLLHTLVPLFLRPGFLTREFVEGRRARYVPPLRLYLVSSFLLFFTLTLLSIDVTGLVRQTTENEADTTATGAAAVVDSTSLPATGAVPADSAGDGQGRPGVVTGREALELGSVDVVIEEVSDSSAFVRRLKRGFLRIQDDPEAFWGRVMGRVPPMMFFLLPVFALLLKLLYVRSERLYMQHFIFSLHFHAFFFLVLMFFSLAGAAAGEWLDGLKGLLVYLGSVVYLFLALRRVYGQSRRKTTMKLVLILFTYPTIVGLALLAVLFVSLLLF